MALDLEEEEGGGAVAAQAAGKPAEGKILLYPVAVETQSGEKLVLQLSHRDSVFDVKQFLLDAPETCFYTCYDLVLHTKDGSAHQLKDNNEISEIADISAGGCSLKMVTAPYNERSVRLHIWRVRELLSLSSRHVSPLTSLALQQEQAKNADTASQELDGLKFMEDNTIALASLLASAPTEIKCVRRIIFSTFNPPPSHRRLRGDLIYIEVETLEGNEYCITGSFMCFYVNRSQGSILDSRCSNKNHEASTLVGLLQKISAMFKKGFREILDKALAHPLENVQALLPVTPWLGAYPEIVRIGQSLVLYSSTSSQDPLASGTEFIDIMPRDWNEELQSCRELPHGNLQERTLRSRALYEVTRDFVDAAVKGAILVIHGRIRPNRENEPDNITFYVHDNILFAFAVDSDYEHISKDQEPDCQNGSSPDLGANANWDHPVSSVTPNSNTEEPNSVLEASAEAQIADNEQETYASTNSILKGIKSYQEADIPGLYNIAMAIIDYGGHRVFAHSIIPGMFRENISILYGTINNGKNITWDEAFHAKVVEAAKGLHVKEHLVLDGSGNPVKLAATVKCHGVVGTDGSAVCLCGSTSLFMPSFDFALTPGIISWPAMNATPRDFNCLGLQHRFSVVRPELVASFVEAASLDRDGKSDGSPAPRPAESNDSIGEILFNLNVFTEHKLAGSPEEIAADEALVKKVGSYLVDTVIPKFVQDLCSLDVSPMDGQTLTDVLHSNGINVRYLGKVAGMIKHLPHLWDLFSAEIIVRSAKHVFKEILRQSPPHHIARSVAQFLNCFAGEVLAASTEGRADSTQSKTQKAHESTKFGQSVRSHLTSDSVWSDIKQFARQKYQYEVPDDATLGAKKVSVIRNLCQKVGVRIVARKYKLDSATPFRDSDILSLLPIVKHSVPICTDARKLMEAGKIQMAEGRLNGACTLFSEALSLLQQINGPMHKDAANCCRYLAIVLYHGGDIEGAIEQQRRELIINERCLGLDHPDTARSYGNMALFYHKHNQTKLALRHMSHTLLLLSLASGPDHLAVAENLINAAMMYQDASNMSIALRYLQEACKKNKQILGPDHIQTASSYHALAIAFCSVGAYKLSVQYETKRHDILVKQLTSDDSRTRDSEKWLERFMEREKQVNAKIQEDRLLKGAKQAKDTTILDL